ncbi:ankyrin repeat domain-containing protein, partial [Staphylococcus aureus]
DPNCLVSETGDSLLHLALFCDQKKVVEVLLRNGACPNLANNEGLTPLHVMCIKDYDYGLAKLFFEINDDIRQTVEINSKDKLGRTALQLAVQKLLPDVVDLLLARGADRS